MNLELIVVLTVFTLSTATPAYSAIPEQYERSALFDARSSYRHWIGGPYRATLLGFGYTGSFGLNINANNNFNNNFINSRSFRNYISHNGFTDEYDRKDTDDNKSYIFDEDEDDDDDDDDSYQFGYRLYREDSRRGYYENNDYNFNDMYSGYDYTGNVDNNHVNMNNYVGFNRYTSNRPGNMNEFFKRPFWGYRSSSTRDSNKSYSSFFIPFLLKKTTFHPKRPMFKPAIPLRKLTKPLSQWRQSVFYQKKNYQKKY